MEERVSINSNSKTKNLKFIISILNLFVGVIAYLFYMLTLNLINFNQDYSTLIFLFSWLGIFLFLYVIITWYKITGKLFTPYTIFILFFFVFNYGQPLMWALGIHISTEIGESTLYGNFGVATDRDIIKVQVLTLISILMFHVGAVFASNKKSEYKLNALKNKKSLAKDEDTPTLKAIYYTSFVIGLVAVPITLFNTYSDFRISQQYGYQALYYSEHAVSNPVLSLVSMMFFPCLVGMLIGSKYNKKVMIMIYSIFLAYLMLNLFAGQRGAWVYKLIILVWLSHACYKPIKFKKSVLYISLSAIGIYVVDAIRSLRNIGINLKAIREALSFENSPFINTIFEMGGSMQPTIILQKHGWDVWPYANTYILALLGMVSNSFIAILGLPFSLISTWFSQDYLGISWGAGFSIIAEALMNFGPYFAPLFMIVLGFIIGYLIYWDKGLNYKKNPLRLFFIVTTLDVFISITRNYFHLLMKEWFYGVLLFCILILIVRFFFFKNMSKERSYSI